MFHFAGFPEDSANELRSDTESAESHRRTGGLVVSKRLSAGVSETTSDLSQHSVQSCRGAAQFHHEAVRRHLQPLPCWTFENRATAHLQGFD